MIIHPRHERLEIAAARPGIAAGWHAHLDLLMDLLEGRPDRDFRPHHTALEAAYKGENVQGDQG